MKLGKIGVALAALSLTASPVLAQSAVAQLGRAIAPSEESSVEGNSTLLIVLGIVAAGVGIALIADDNGPSSP